MGQNHVEEFLQMDMQKILEYRNARNRFCQRVGITVTELSPGYAKVVKTVTGGQSAHRNFFCWILRPGNTVA